MKRRRSINYFDLISDYFFNRFNMDSFKDEPKHLPNFNDHTSENDGTIEITTGEDENGTWERREWTSADGKAKMTSYVMKSFNKKDVDMEDLKQQLKTAVNNEDYELAAKIKKQIDSL